MKGIKFHSIVFKTAIIYLFVTLLNVSIFVLMVFENQLDFIAENAIINSQLKASNFKYRIDNVLADGADLSGEYQQNPARSRLAGYKTLSIFSEAGKYSSK